MTPDDADKQRKRDEGFAALGDVFPPLWRRLYCNLQSEGFTDKECFVLVQTYIIANGTAPATPPKD